MARLGSKQVAIVEEPGRNAESIDGRSEAGRTTEQDLESLKSWQGEEATSYDLVDLSCGTTHSFARTLGGHIYGWGANSSGELGFAGDDAQSYFWVPKELMIPGRSVKQICCGHEFTLAVTNQQEIFAWGKGSEGQLGLGHCRDEREPTRIGLEKVLSCAAGEQHSAAIVEDTDGTRLLYTWGMADSGVLGLGNFITCGPCNQPNQVEFELSDKDARAAKNPLLVRCGANHTAVLCGNLKPSMRLNAELSAEENFLWTFGNGWHGRLGLGDTKSQFLPKRVKMRPVRDISLGFDHTAAITARDELYVWGKGTLLGEVVNVLTPKRFTSVEGTSQFKSVLCGENETFVIDSMGRLHSWGSNNCGQLGLGQLHGQFVTTPTLVKAIHEPVSSIISGGSFTIAHLENGDLLAWGSQSCGRLGLVEPKDERICWDPSLVVATWSTAAAVCAKKPTRGKKRPSQSEGGGDTRSVVTEDAPKTSSNKDKTANVVSFVMLQTLLKQESEQLRSDALKRYADKLQHTAKTILQEIRELRAEEEPLATLQGQFNDALKLSLRWFPGPLGVPDASNSLVDPRIPEYLATYSRMCWILQQQTTYLSQLAMHISGDEADVFLETVDCLFGDVQSTRQVSLFNSLLTSMIAKEAENAGGYPAKFLTMDSVSFLAFRRRALGQAFAREVLFPLLSSKDSILELVGSISSSGTNNGFCLSYTDFKERLGSDGRGKDEAELKNMYSLSLNAFREFLTGGFLKIIRKMRLPNFVRLVLHHVALASQRWKEAEGFVDIDKDLRPYQPVLRLFCHGILGPVMRDASRYAVPHYFLKKTSADYKPDDPQIAANLECVADFLDQMLNNSIDPKEKALISAARYVKEELLTYMRDVSTIEDTLGPDILGAMLCRHFCRNQSFVSMSQAHLMKLSNLLHAWSNKLRIRERDELDMCVKSVPEWEKEAVAIAERYEVTLNFTLDTRYMIDNQDILLCLQSSCPLPSWACSAKASQRLVFIEDEAAGNAQGAFFESLFRRCQPIESKDFARLRNEFKTRRQQLAAGGHEEGDLQMINDLDTAVQQINELIDVGAEPKQLLDLMVDRVQGRQRQFRYLEVTDRHLKAVLARQQEYMKDLRQQKAELKGAVEFSLALKLPNTLSKACSVYGTTPSFTNIQKKVESVPSLIPAKDIADIGCSYIPMATFSIAQLKKQKVLVEVCPPFSAMQKMMEITFKKQDEQAVEITASVAQGGNKNIVKKILLEPSKLNELRAAKSDATADFGEPAFMVCNSVNLIGLLTKIEKGTR
ncbi:unnamed protein product [Effrenium voratum]|uniref:Uncharacterized protein n=1 Tax=Effrenium voratum TaxID=2562239 RepID=A0AA36J304_9DINO|nr:unnamed protein product [Effrenium voratum]CAJ1448063.1 unnamed protein product [Effrenium voratum]